VAGSAGTGKTIVALHRAVHLARKYPESRVLLTTFSETLANALRVKLRRLIGDEPRLGERLEVHSIASVGCRLHESHIGKVTLATDEQVKELLGEAAAKSEVQRFNQSFLWTEWSSVVDAWQLADWEAYRDVRRLGRKTRLAEGQREALWMVFQGVRAELDATGLTTLAGVFGKLAAALPIVKNLPYDIAVVDESQDLGVSELRFLGVLAGGRSDSLFFAGDLGQRIFQQPFSWKALGIDIRGRSSTLRINYRTSHQIRSHADKLLGPEMSDVDGVKEDRRGTASVFNGPAPDVELADSEEAECRAVADRIEAWGTEGLAPHEIAIFVRSEAQLPRAEAAAKASGVPYLIVGPKMETSRGKLSISPMHQAKGLEFRAVIVMACDDEILPLQERIEAVSDESDLEDVYNTERHLLYVACTRARDHLLVMGVEPGSEFLDDFAA